MKPLILITNDDGIESPGLWAVCEALIDFGDLLVVAPTVQQTGMGRSFPRACDTGIIDSHQKKIGGKDIIVYGVHGSPAQAVSHAVIELATRKPDLCISGINYGENLGLSLTCSGTLGAAFEADSHDIPAFAFSRQHSLESQQSNEFEKLNWEAHKHFVKKLVMSFFEKPFPTSVHIVNVNFPNDLTNETDMKITKQSRLNYSVFKKKEKRNFNEPYLLMSEIEIHRKMIEEDSDIYAVCFEKMVSITPLTWRLSVDVESI